ncbi:MAG: ankyrin repeat domain-containing protein [bacterium]|nr:ankyrin repeat domain-containing protein [bacterium]
MSTVHALVQAAFCGNAAEVLSLLDLGVPIDAQDGEGWNALHAAIENEERECISLLIKNGADIARVVNGLTPLAHAVDISIDGTIQTGGSQGDEPVDIVRYLLSVGADPLPGLIVAESYGSQKLIALLSAAEPRYR